MNHSPSGSLNLEKAIQGFLTYKMAEGLSDRSVDSYERILKKWADYTGEKRVASITSQDIIAYLNWLRTDYVPQRITGSTQPLFPKTLRNVWIALSSFFEWAKLEFQIGNPVRDVPPPKFKTAPVEAYTQEEVECMLKACLYTREVRPHDRHKFVMHRRWEWTRLGTIFWKGLFSGLDPILIERGLVYLSLFKFLIRANHFLIVCLRNDLWNR